MKRSRSFKTIKVLATVLVAVSSVLAGPATAQEAETLSRFDSGNTHYEKGEYDQAAAAYESAVETGYHSAALHYNLGNSYYRLDEIGKAVLNYERALLLDPENRAIKHSLDLAQTRMMDRMSELPDPIWTTAWRKIIASLGLSGVLWSGMLLYAVGITLIILRVWTGGTSPWFRRGALIALSIGVPMVAISLLASRASTERPRSVVLERAVPVRQGPNADSPSELEIHEGLVVRTIEMDSSWIRVQLPNGVTGWIERSAVEHI